MLNLAELQAEVEANEEKQAEESSDEMPNQIANPVVYKLVRVEGDGRLVPATDDEVMEVENMFEEEKVETPLIVNTGQVEGHVINKESPSVKAKTQDSEGKLQGENTKVDAEKLNARLEYIGVMLQKVKQEEKLRLSSPSPDHSSNCMIVDGQYSDQHDKLSAVEEKLQTNQSLQEPPLPSPKMNDSCTNQLGSRETCPRPTNGLEVGGSSTTVTASASCRSSIPDFSRIKGEICLDNLSIKELHETFRATFGRETSVKDKLWLKRRIAMGLTNSCNVSTTTFVIKDNILIGKKTKEEHFRIESSNNLNQINEMDYDSCRDSPTSPTVQGGDQHIVSCKRLRNTQAEYECKTEDVEHSAAKRVRKPTKRYIEELSESDTRECGGRFASSIQNSESSPKSRVRPICDASMDETTLVTRQDSLGGSGVQVPYVSRVRRGRPRENFMSIMQQYHPSNMGMSERLVNKALGVHIAREDGESGDRNWEDRVAPKHIQPQVVAKTDQEMENIVKCMDEPEPEPEPTVKLEKLDSFGDNSDCNDTLPTSKDGFRRKHHRAWTLCEVIKLVEGVSKYGHGRWSEIKKVAFGSYNYRTSVDLKDKWRNLLRASFAQGSNGNGMSNSRKPGSMPIPAPILVRVRQLAEKHSQAAPDLSSGKKFLGCNGRSVHETRSGYL